MKHPMPEVHDEDRSKYNYVNIPDILSLGARHSETISFHTKRALTAIVAHVFPWNI